MKKIIIHLPNKTHHGLKALATEANVSVAKLIKRAVELVYGEDIEDINDMEKEIAYYEAHPESAVSLETVLRRRNEKDAGRSRD